MRVLPNLLLGPAHSQQGNIQHFGSCFGHRAYKLKALDPEVCDDSSFPAMCPQVSFHIKTLGTCGRRKFRRLFEVRHSGFFLALLDGLVIEKLLCV